MSYKSKLLSEKQITNLAEINFILMFAGYMLITNVFLGGVSEAELTQTVTIPYRFFTCFISILTIFFNLSFLKRFFYRGVFIFVFFWMLFLFRLFYDLCIQSEFKFSGVNQVVLLVLGVTIPYIISVTVSFHRIRLNRCLYIICILYLFSFILSIINNSILTSELTSRINANVALNTIAFGQYGVYCSLISLYLLNSLSQKIKKIILFASLITSIYIIFKAGSRGPLIALILVFSLYLFMKSKIKFGFTIFAFSLIFILFWNQFYIILEKISPVMTHRLSSTFLEGDTSGRDSLYSLAINYISQKPFFGYSFALPSKTGHFIYTHNLFLDVLMSVGILGSVFFIVPLGKAFYSSYNCISKEKKHIGITLLFFASFFFNQSSGAFYLDPIFNSLIIYILLITRNNSRNESMFYGAGLYRPAHSNNSRK